MAAFFKKYIRYAKTMWVHLQDKFHERYDRRLDKKICGCDLTKYVPSLYRQSKGATGSQATHYRILDVLFEGFTFTKEDSLIDIGCGKGRVLAYLLLHHFPGRLTGIELNADVVAIAQNWSKRYDNVHIIAGDAFALDLTKYNYFFWGRPFEKKIFLQFLAKFEAEIEQKVHVFYWVDQQSGHFLHERPGWTMILKGKIDILKVFSWLPIPFAAASCPQGYSIWEYDPIARKAYDKPTFEELADCRDYSLLPGYHIDIEYCKRHDVSFDRSVTGQIYWLEKKTANQ